MIQGPIVAEDSQQKNQREKEERKRMQMYLTIQSKEIKELKAEITVLKRKDSPSLSQSLSLTSINHYQGTRRERELILSLFIFVSFLCVGRFHILHILYSLPFSSLVFALI